MKGEAGLWETHGCRQREGKVEEKKTEAVQHLLGLCSVPVLGPLYHLTLHLRPSLSWQKVYQLHLLTRKPERLSY